jgi:hypothetical protein
MWYSKFDKIWLGAALGICAPVITLIIVYVYSFDGYSVKQFFHFLTTMHILTKLLSLCALSNLGVFFIFIWLNLMKGARGVLISTMLVALIICSFMVLV